MMTNKKVFTIFIIAIIILGILVLILSISKPKQTTPLTPDIKTTPDVTISTDKNDYNEGEVINIVVKNGLDKSILYSSGGDRFWGIEYFKDDKWINPAYEKGGGFQLTKENIGDNCYIALYEIMPPSELIPQSTISSQWNQKICPFGTEGPAKAKTVRYIESGTYRLIFNYGFEILDDDPYRISDFKKIYSNTFVIERTAG